MKSTTHSTRRGIPIALTGIALLFAAAIELGAQGTMNAPATSNPPSAKSAAPIDLTGYWVSLVTEDWRWRMVTPAKGDYQSVPITVEAKKAADAWDPAKDEAAGEQCKSYGAAALMRVPGRLHITWQDDNTLKVETDAGTQTRLLHFGSWKAPQGPATWQGDSVASWEIAKARGKFGSLKVVTTHMRAGYLRKNGIPYSADAVMTEYWDLYRERSGMQWIAITTEVKDRRNLQQDYLTSPNFKKEPDGSKWDPTPCSARW